MAEPKQPSDRVRSITKGIVTGLLRQTANRFGPESAVRVVKVMKGIGDAVLPESVQQTPAPESEEAPLDEETQDELEQLILKSEAELLNQVEDETEESE